MSGESSLSCIELGRFQTPTIIKDGARLKTDLFTEVDGVMDFIKKHINKAYIITGRPQREERWDYPLDALREIVVNAIVHHNYSSSSDSVVKIYDNQIEFFNPGRLPEELSIEKLQFEEFSGGFRVTVYKRVERITAAVATDQVGTKLGLSRDQVEIMAKLSSEQGILGLMGILGRTNRTKFRDQVLSPLIEDRLIEMTIPDKPRSSKQKYRLTEKGKKLIARNKGRMD